MEPINTFPPGSEDEGISPSDSSNPVAEFVEEQSSVNRFTPLVAVVDFNHARGPETECWFGAPNGSDPAVDNDWPLLPFMALSDGAHASTQEFSYFTLLRKMTAQNAVTSLFGIACSRQIDSSMLLERPNDVTRSTVQKAVVVITDTPQSFGMLRERLSVVTTAWFSQRNFKDTEILRRFQESLKEEKERNSSEKVEERDDHFGMSLRELVRQFKWQTLVLFKCCLLQPKMLFFSSTCEKLCMIQFSLISLIPGLIRNLQTCADPELCKSPCDINKPNSLQTSNRSSLLTYLGLPLQIFGKGSLFGPYTPLQQLDLLADFGTKSYIVGSTNSLLLQQKDRYSDILINLDEDTINISSSSLRSALALTVADRRWIDFIIQTVNDTWDESNPSRPKNMGYVGSQEFIRFQFEEYLLSLLSAVKYHNHILENAGDSSVLLPQIEGDPSSDFGVDWIEAWIRSENYQIWNRSTDNHIFNIVEPKHPCTGSLTIEDVKARMMNQVKEFLLDERFAVGKEILGRNLQAGKEKANVILNKLYADMEALRVSQKRKTDGAKPEAQRGIATTLTSLELNSARLTAQNIGNKAGAYIGSWGMWMDEKRKSGWGRGLGQQTKPNDDVKVSSPKTGNSLNPPESPKPHKRSFVEEVFDADNPITPEDFRSPISPSKNKSISSQIALVTPIEKENKVISTEIKPL
ncbi:Late secretory pathway protein AVL9 [Golovinomyces cichoracearum]|uniref:Late secretory pathway protein AVL9 n=1 Tax=Golovinomyces cichoracearum TaxID=62708 RepID=A0A420J126_9PEZI|nr:Late secretory pathway protein AVL9 [Golovinomyces cichoracearum]